MAFYPNKTLDYRTRIEWAPVPDSGAFSSTSILGVVTFPYGIPYAANVAGFRVEFECADPVYGSFDTTFKITTPGADYTDSGSGAVDHELWVYFDGASMTVDPDCDSWAFSADKIGFYQDEERTLPLLELTSFNDFGTGYDRRDLVQEWSALVATALPIPGSSLPGCDPIGVGMSSTFADCFWELSEPGEEDWKRRPIELTLLEVPDPDPDPVDCGCSASPYGIEIDEDFKFGMVGMFDASITMEDVWVSCPCPVPIGDPPVSEPYLTRKATWQYTSRGANLWPAPTNFRLTKIDLSAQATEWCCDGMEPPPVTADEFVTNSKTYVQFSRSVVNSQGVKWCPYPDVQLCTNGAPHGPCAGPNECCFYAGEQAGLWQYVGCPVERVLELDVLGIPNGYTFWASIGDDGLICDRALFGLTEGLESTSVIDEIGDAPSLTFMPDDRVLCGFTVDAAFFVKTSTDDGLTWSEAVSLLEGDYGRIVASPAGDQIAAVYRDDHIYFKYRPSGAGWTSERVVKEGLASSPTDFEEAAFGLSFDHSIGGWLLYATRQGEDGPTAFLSTDDETFKEV